MFHLGYESILLAECSYRYAVHIQGFTQLLRELKFAELKSLAPTQKAGKADIPSLYIYFANIFMTTDKRKRLLPMFPPNVKEGNYEGQMQDV